MHFFKQISFALTAFLLGTSTLSAKSIETNAGLTPFTVYFDGAIRLYYDSNSRVAQMSYVNDKGQQYATQEIKYDNYGTVGQRTLKENCSFWCSRTTNFQYIYSKTNRVLEEKQTYGFNERKLCYHYDLFGNLDHVRSHESTFGIFYTPKESMSNRYTPDGRLEARTYYNKNGNVALHHEWDYDFQGRVIAKRIYDADLDLVARIVYEYDVAKGVDQETNYDAYNNVLSLVYNYRDDQGRLFERTLRDAQGGLVAVTSYEYTPYNQLTCIKDFDAHARLLGCIATHYDMLSRPYLHEYSYKDHDLLLERLKKYLDLPGNDL